jgi:hypothetical protein
VKHEPQKYLIEGSAANRSVVILFSWRKLRVHFLCLPKAPKGIEKNGTKRKGTLRFGRYATTLRFSPSLAQK